MQGLPAGVTIATLSLEGQGCHLLMTKAGHAEDGTEELSNSLF